jgi:hypothetical protein
VEKARGVEVNVAREARHYLGSADLRPVRGLRPQRYLAFVYCVA